eukprot:2650451-Amphidinium_carterae.2
MFNSCRIICVPLVTEGSSTRYVWRTRLCQQALGNSATRLPATPSPRTIACSVAERFGGPKS